jgi:hypothetical protein
MGGPLPCGGKTLGRLPSKSTIKAEDDCFSDVGADDLKGFISCWPPFFEITGGGGGFLARLGLPFRFRIDLSGPLEWE